MRGKLLLWSAFILSHLLLCVYAYYAVGFPLGDVSSVYTFWTQQVFEGNGIVGVTDTWVYPVGALIPMLLAGIAGTQVYTVSWLVLVTLVNAVGFAILIGPARSRGRQIAAWWWLVFIMMLGPISLGRFDTITVPMVIVGLLLVSSRPALAGAIVAFAAWIKVWPAVVGAAVVLVVKRRVNVLGGALAFTGILVLLVWLCGGREHLFGFLSEQGSRGLQVEAVLATPWTWMSVFSDDTWVYYDQGIYTNQIVGPGTAQILMISTPLLVLLTAGLLLLGVRAIRRNVSATELVPVLALALTLALIIGNKVGSPQFATWIAAPIVVGIVSNYRRWVVPAIMGIVIAVLTQMFYPVLYGYYLNGDPLMLSVASFRNIGYIALFVWAGIRLWTMRGVSFTSQSRMKVFS